MTDKPDTPPHGAGMIYAMIAGAAVWAALIAVVVWIA